MKAKCVTIRISVLLNYGNINTYWNKDMDGIEL